LIDNDILKAFNLSGTAASLGGGQNTSLRVEDAVLKPASDDEPFMEWGLTVLNDINPHGYRLSKPIASKYGTFIYKGWSCTRYEPGEHINGNVKQKLEVSRLFHRDLAGMSFANMPKSNDRWSISHRVAWQKEGLPGNIHKEACAVLEKLLSGLELKASYNMQIVHADLSGNILFSDALGPLIIDFSPTVAPAEYAEAILVCDSIAWHGCPVTDIDLIYQSEFHGEMMRRAVIFRLAVAAIFAGNDYDMFIGEYRNFKPILEYLA
jgi:hypothetical protein